MPQALTLPRAISWPDDWPDVQSDLDCLPITSVSPSPPAWLWKASVLDRLYVLYVWPRSHWYRSLHSRWWASFELEEWNTGCCIPSCWLPTLALHSGRLSPLYVDLPIRDRWNHIPLLTPLHFHSTTLLTDDAMTFVDIPGDPVFDYLNLTFCSMETLVDQYYCWYWYSLLILLLLILLSDLLLFITVSWSNCYSIVSIIIGLLMLLFIDLIHSGLMVIFDRHSIPETDWSSILIPFIDVFDAINSHSHTLKIIVNLFKLIMLLLIPTVFSPHSGIPTLLSLIKPDDSDRSFIPTGPLTWVMTHSGAPIPVFGDILCLLILIQYSDDDPDDIDSSTDRLIDRSHSDKPGSRPYDTVGRPRFWFIRPILFLTFPSDRCRRSWPDSLTWSQLVMLFIDSIIETIDPNDQWLTLVLLVTGDTIPVTSIVVVDWKQSVDNYGIRYSFSDQCCVEMLLLTLSVFSIHSLSMMLLLVIHWLIYWYSLTWCCCYCCWSVDPLLIVDPPMVLLVGIGDKSLILLSTLTLLLTVLLLFGIYSVLTGDPQSWWPLLEYYWYWRLLMIIIGIIVIDWHVLMKSISIVDIEMMLFNWWPNGIDDPLKAPSDSTDDPVARGLVTVTWQPIPLMTPIIDIGNYWYSLTLLLIFIDDIVR